MNKKKILPYLSSPSARLGMAIGILMYVSYAVAHGAFGNIWLILLCAFVSGFIPYYSKLSNKLEEKANLRWALVSVGRFARFLPQLAFNLAVFAILTVGKVVPVANLGQLGGIIGVALLTTCASQGMQYLAIMCSNREIGDRNRNVLLALSINILVTALATLGWPSAKALFLALGLGFGALFFTIGLLSDLRGIWFMKRGVGVFFGTFNPIHRTHLALIQNAIQQRNLKKVYLHCTGVPKLHAQALERGEIRISHYDGGMRIYATTERADVHVNYFPTGKMFYEYETRLKMMRVAVEEAGMSKVVEVISLPDVYQKDGFFGVLREIKKLAPNEPLHGIHGSDLGGMWVRGIYDESGWIYPLSVVRRDGVSATAIRNGAKGMTTKTVQEIIDSLRGSDGTHRNGIAAKLSK